MDFGADERDWGAVHLLIEELDEELTERRSALLYKLCAWNMILRVFKRAVREKMILKSPSNRDTAYHRSILASLKGSGRILLRQLKDHQKIDPALVGITYLDFAAAVEELEYQEREWYGDMTDPFRQNLISEIFPDAVPQA